MNEVLFRSETLNSIINLNSLYEFNFLELNTYILDCDRSINHWDKLCFQLLDYQPSLQKIDTEIKRFIGDFNLTKEEKIKYVSIIKNKFFAELESVKLFFKIGGYKIENSDHMYGGIYFSKNGQISDIKIDGVLHAIFRIIEYLNYELDIIEKSQSISEEKNLPNNKVLQNVNPNYEWDNKNELSQLIFVLYQSKRIRDKNGDPLEKQEIVTMFETFFGKINVKDLKKNLSTNKVQLDGITFINELNNYLKDEIERIKKEK